MSFPRAGSFDHFRKTLVIAAGLASSELRGRYRRSILGPWWLTLGAAIGVLGLGLVWSTLLNVPTADLVPRLAVSLILWQFISGCVLESAGVYVRQGQVIRNFALPFWIYPCQLVFRHLATLCHNLVVVVAVFLVFPEKFSGQAYLSVFGLALTALALSGAAAVIGSIGARFRDVEPLLQSVMPLIFFVTPVLYEPSQLGPRMYVVWLNPMSYLIEIVRGPFFGNIPSPAVYLVALAFTIATNAAAYLLLSSKGKRLPFWI